MNSEEKAWQCPKCNFNFKKKYDYMSKINNLLKLRSLSTKTHLRTIAHAIKLNVPSDAHRDKYYFFLYNVQGVSDIVLEWGLDQYFKGKHYLKGKGFAYLKSIIMSRDKNIERMSIKE